MRKIRLAITSLFLSVAALSQAQSPTGVNTAPIMVNATPQRYALYFEANWCKNCYKLDTRTGQLWEIKGDWIPEKIEIKEFTGIEKPAENDSYDGRFIFRPMAYNGLSWLYVFDTKTGNLWTSKLGKSPDYILKLVK